MTRIPLLATESPTNAAVLAGPRLVAPIALVAMSGLVGLGAVAIRGDLGLGGAAAIAVVAAVSGHHDARSGRIPNRYVLVVLGLVVAGAALLVLVGDRSTSGLLANQLAALLLGGAPLLFVIWLVTPALVGGGDWKLLGALSLALGLTEPLAAGAMVALVFVSVAGDAVLRRRRHVLLGPHLALAYVVVVAVLLWSPDGFDGVLG